MTAARIVDGWLVLSDGRISHFKEKEFYVGSNWFNRGSLPKIDEDLVDMLEDLRIMAGVPIFISSGVRSKAANAAAGGASNSLHLTGGAADFHSPGKTPWDFVEALESVTAEGSLSRYGIYHRLEGGHCHIDIDLESTLRRFVKIGGKYLDLMDWVLDNFPMAKKLEDVPRVEANRLLGF